MRRAILILLLTASLLPGCASWKYNSIRTGKVGGLLTIQWVGADKFIYRPDPERPFYFRRANGEIIRPQRMYTDGGSIPRPLWALRGYSPWGYGPAFIAHDWLFDAHHCHRPEAEGHTVLTAADVLAECMKTLMETNPDVIKSPFLLYTIDGAVRTSIARKLWDEGKCTPPPPELAPAGQIEKRFLAAKRQPGTSGWVQTFDLDKVQKR